MKKIRWKKCGILLGLWADVFIATWNMGNNGYWRVIQFCFARCYQQPLLTNFTYGYWYLW